MIQEPNPAGTEPPPPPPSDPPYRGVGGWLIVLCIGLGVLTPIVGVWSIVTSYQALSPLFEAFPGLRLITWIDFPLSVALMAFSIYTAYGLATVRPGAVRTAKTFFLCSLGYTVVSSILPFCAGLPSSANGAMAAEVAKGAVRSVVSFAVWYSYLNVSKRVKATYAS